MYVPPVVCIVESVSVGGGKEEEEVDNVVFGTL